MYLPALYKLGLGFYIIFDIFSNKILFSLSISVYRSKFKIEVKIQIC